MAAVENEGQGPPFMNLHLPDRLEQPQLLFNMHVVWSMGLREQEEVELVGALREHDDTRVEGFNQTNSTWVKLFLATVLKH